MRSLSAILPGERGGIVTSIILRFLSLASKGILIFFIAGRLSLEDVGSYGLISAISGYLAFFLGVEFYSHSSRHYVGGTALDKHFAFKNHIFLSLLLYLMTILPLVIMGLLYHIEPIIVALTFAITVGEHATLEVQRYYNFTFRPVFASLIFFIRAGLWPIVAIVLIAAHIIVGIIPILSLWVLGLMTALIVAGFSVRNGIAMTLKSQLSREWMLAGIVISVPLLIGTLALRSFFSLDRVLVAAIGNPGLLAAYVVYASIINAVISLADAGIIAYQFPLALRAARNEDYHAVRKHGIILAVHGAGATLVMAAAGVIAIWLVAPLLDKPQYAAHLDAAVLLALSAVLYVAGQGPQAILFALRADRQAIVANLIGMALFVAGAFVMMHRIPSTGVPLAACIGFAAILLMKGIFARSVLRSRTRKHLA